jgi:hypothetical protein
VMHQFETRNNLTRKLRNSHGRASVDKLSSSGIESRGF